MDISGMTPALSALQSYDAGSSVSQTSLSYAVSTELLSQQLDMTQEMGTAMVQMMERSLTYGNRSAYTTCNPLLFILQR